MLRMPDFGRANILSAICIDSEEVKVPLVALLGRGVFLAFGLPGVGENNPSGISRPCSSRGRGASSRPVCLD